MGMNRNNRLELALYTATIANQELRASTKKLTEGNDALEKSLRSSKSKHSSDSTVKAFRAAVSHLAPGKIK